MKESAVPYRRKSTESCGREKERIRDAGKHGFKVALVPAANAPRKAIPGLKVIAVHHLQQAIDALKDGWL